MLSGILNICTFLQQTTTDGVPFWIVVSRDVVIPGLALFGGAFAFSVWFSRKKKEHLLIHKTKAYEILLDKEMKCYEELIPMVDKVYKAIACAHQGYNNVISHNKTVDVVLLMLDFEKDINKIADFVTKNRIYMNTDINEACDEFIVAGFRYHATYQLSYTTTVENSESDDLPIDKAFGEYSGTVRKLNEQIRKRLEGLSCIK